MIMTIRSRILGYSVLLEKPIECFCCYKKIEPEILERVLDNDNGVLRYGLVMKCRDCHEVFFVLYLIGEETQLSNIELESNKNPIKPLLNNNRKS